LRSQFLDAMPFDSKSFDAFFYAGYSRLCVFISRITGSDLMVEDIATDAFVVVWDQREALHDLTDAHKLLYSVARHAALNHVRTERSREQLVAHEVAAGAPVPGRSRGHANPEYDVEQVDVDDAIRAAIAELPPVRRQVYSLRWEHDWSTAEIAAVLQLSVKTVEMHVTLAHKALRSALAPYHP